MILEEAVLSPLARWENFYVIVGSSGGALTGLQFVVIALVAEAQAASSMLEIRAFGSPTVMHFCGALLISAIETAPWPELFRVAVALGVCGAAGVIYSISTIRHARRQTSYQPDAADWAWYAGLPLLTYLALVVAAILLPRSPVTAQFVVAATALLLLFIGIHNSWDTVTYIAVRRGQGSKENR